ncbi:Manganese-transporting ATPase 1 [Smittium culicis]|uniref:Manganese-transporting ATPase 1 n=1 Tax=Smittium culicis TaxID=133412 RepID=A0A1R1WXQ7_9FUNG|nr:Manganese-transporting ATPase 1 [Smittium culicis]OMJ18139.1 Manganese-transporting ATPase 1 [Smittium culicis]
MTTQRDKPLVLSKIIKDAAIYKKLPPIQRHYNWPFLFVYPIWLYIYFAQYNVFLGSYEWTFVSLVFTIGSQILLMLVCQWDVNVKALFTCTPVNSVYDAEVIKIIAADHQGKSEIVKILFTENLDKKQKPVAFFYFQALKFIWSNENSQFNTIGYPCDLPNLVSHYQKSKGLLTENDIEKAKFDFGTNLFSIPIPTFIELFKEHAVAPFFVFQILCVGLWCLDEYWYYPIFTLFMLVVFESTLVFQRVKTLNEFRSLSLSPFDVHVYRKNAWTSVSTVDLLPGDLVSITRSEGDNGVPCDVVILDGNCIVNEAMLSGESTPQLKESLSLRDGDDTFDIEVADKNSMLFGGTKVLQIDTSKLTSTIKTPDNGCLCLVLRTGFGTSQGGLVRTMVFSTQQVSANNTESYIFILFLLMFAILASSYVWVEGRKNEKRSTTKILLDCILIITSVVPPELPMELSLAVNSSLVALSKFAIFCTEPFRIPYAGKVDICCFDKTGTLTAEELVVDGVAGVINSDGSWDSNAPKELQNVSSLSVDSILTLASSHALVLLDDGTIVGDPMEKAQLASTNFEFQKNGKISLSKKDKTSKLSWANDLNISTKRRFPFSSVLKRSSSLVDVNWGFEVKNKKYLVGVKGAPEALKGMFKEIPNWYDETYKNFSRRGGRVLALGSKWIQSNKTLSDSKINEFTRDEIESELVFQGFLVFSCPLKEDSVAAIKMLNESQHRCIMITGDNALTAVHVAKQVKIVIKNALIFDVNNNGNVVCSSVDEKFTFTLQSDHFNNSEEVERISRVISGWDLCTTGQALDMFAGSKLWKDYLLHNIWVYARVSYFTLMCGDGTNDVGALKQSHIGVALLNGTEEDLRKIAERNRIERIKSIYDSQVKISQRFNQPIPPPPKELQEHMRNLQIKDSTKSETTVQPARPRPNNPASATQDKVNEFLMSMESMEDDVPKIKFGDASVAAPFTSKLGTIKSVTSIIRQGRCTLVATIQMYKILALNSLISAYSMSVLYLEGIKFGDYQATIMGILMSVCFMCISKASPIEKLSRERPQSNILNLYVLLTVLCQFAVHIGALVFLTLQVRKYEPSGEVDIGGEFKPSLLNTAMYLISLSQQISTFAINYQGHPFRESLRENVYLYRGLMGVGIIVALCATEYSADLNAFMKLVEMPSAFRDSLCLTIIADFYLAFLAEKLIHKLFSQTDPKPISFHPLSEFTKPGKTIIDNETVVKPSSDIPRTIENNSLGTNEHGVSTGREKSNIRQRNIVTGGKPRESSAIIDEVD